MAKKEGKVRGHLNPSRLDFLELLSIESLGQLLPFLCMNPRILAQCACNLCLLQLLLLLVIALLSLPDVS
jgi:hypothetical protein